MIRPKKEFSNPIITNRLTASGLMHTKKSPLIIASIPYKSRKPLTDDQESAVAASTRSDRFIPFTKSDVIEMCIKDAQLTQAENEGFRDFCQILGALFHFEFHARLEKLKACYGPFNPDADTRRIFNTSESEKKNLQKQLVSEMTAVLDAANFEKVTAADLQQALGEESLFQIRLEVDFDDFEDVWKWTLTTLKM
jgi:hypothetical protein